MTRFVAVGSLFALAAAAFAQPATFTDLGVHNSAAETVTSLVRITSPTNIQWYKIVLPQTTAADGYVDFFTTNTASPIPTLDMSDTEIGVYDAAGNLLNSDDDSGPGLWSQLSYGQTSPVRPATTSIPGNTGGLTFIGQQGNLGGGVYWVAVGRFNVTFNTTNWNVTSAYTGAQTDTQLNIRIQPPGSPIPPSGSGVASPATINQGDSTLLTVAVAPGSNPVSTGLGATVDLTALGGSATQTMYDDASHGDASAGDNIFSYTLSTTLSTPGGSFTLPFRVTDAQSRNATGNIALRIVVPPQWDEALQGGSDTGDLPATAQMPTGTNPFSVLAGNIESTADVDMYRINICNPTIFTATTNNPDTLGDTQLFLFNSTGVGVTSNDDVPDGFPGDTTLLSRISGTFVTAPGTYYIAIARYNRNPVDEVGQLLWIDTPFNTERAADGPGGANPVASWVNTSGAAGAYRIEMTGVCFDTAGPACDPDLNQDGNADQDDVAYLINVVGGGDNPTNIDPDFNHDGNADQDDIASLVNVVGGGNCP